MGPDMDGDELQLVNEGEAMKQCAECGARGLRRVAEKREMTVGPRTFVGVIEELQCEKCHARFASGPSGVAFELGVARWLAEHGFATGGEIRLMRKAAGLRAADLADLLGVAAESVSHWETGKHQADHGMLATIGALVLDALDGSTATRDRLRALRNPVRRGKVRLKIRGVLRSAA
jgi:DNA-binding XRE family transcriptional regulator